jgi:hypothetical protein
MIPNTNIYARNIISTDELLLSDTHKQEYKYKMGDLAGYVRYMPQIITVAKSGWRFNKIQDALDSINDANYSTKPYFIDVATPGEYDEAINLKDGVDIIARDPFNTYILRQVTDNGVPVR